MDDKRFRPRKRTSNNPQEDDDNYYNRDTGSEQQPGNRSNDYAGNRYDNNSRNSGGYYNSTPNRYENRPGGGYGQPGGHRPREGNQDRNWQGPPRQPYQDNRSRPQPDNRRGYQDSRPRYDNRGQDSYRDRGRSGGGGYGGSSYGRPGYENRQPGGYENRQPSRYDNRQPGGYENRQPGGYGRPQPSYRGGGGRPDDQRQYGGGDRWGGGGGRPQRQYDDSRGGGGGRNYGAPRPAGKPRGAKPGGHNKRPMKPSALTLVKALVKLNYASRRLALKIIQEGSVKINGMTVEQPNTPVMLERDILMAESTVLNDSSDNQMYFAYHKPSQVVISGESSSGGCTFLNKEKKWYFPVGRLDEASTGIVIVTNDPLHRNSEASPLLGIEKEYRIKVHKAPLKKDLTSIEKSLNKLIADKSEKSKVTLLQKNSRNAWLSVVVHSTSPKAIRTILKENKLEVLSFERYRVGNVTADALPPGSWRRFSEEVLQGAETLPPVKTKSAAASKDKPAEEESAAGGDDKKTLWQQLYQQWFKST